MSRTVKIFSTQSNTQQTLSSSTATTWGELKTEASNAGISIGSMKAVVKETKVSLEADEAVLPTGDFTLFLFPVKVKSGNNTKVKTLVNNAKTEILQIFADLEERIDQIATETGVTNMDDLADEANTLAEELG